MVEISENGITAVAGINPLRGREWMRTSRKSDKTKIGIASALALPLASACNWVAKHTRYAIVIVKIYPIAFHLILFDLHRCWYGFQSSLHCALFLSLLLSVSIASHRSLITAIVSTVYTLGDANVSMFYWILNMVGIDFGMLIFYQFISSCFVDMMRFSLSCVITAMPNAAACFPLIHIIYLLAHLCAFSISIWILHCDNYWDSHHVRLCVYVCACATFLGIYRFWSICKASKQASKHTHSIRFAHVRYINIVRISHAKRFTDALFHITILISSMLMEWK